MKFDAKPPAADAGKVSSGHSARGARAPWERVGISGEDALAVEAVLSAIRLATEPRTYGAALRECIDAHSRTVGRVHADGYARFEQLRNENWRDWHYATRAHQGSGEDSANDREIDPAREIHKLHLDRLENKAPRKLAKLSEPNSKIIQDAGRVTPSNVDRLGGFDPDTNDPDVSDDGHAMRYAGHRQLSLAMIGAAMRGAPTWFSCDLLAMHWNDLASAEQLAKRVNRSPKTVRTQLAAAYRRIAVARQDAARGNRIVREIVRGYVAQIASREDRGDARIVLIEEAPRQLWPGDCKDVAAGLRALRAPMPMLAAYRHPNAMDAARDYQARRAEAAQAIAGVRAIETGRQAAIDVTSHRETVRFLGAARDRDAISRKCVAWEADQRRSSPAEWKGIPPALPVGRTSETKREKRQADEGDDEINGADAPENDASPQVDICGDTRPVALAAGHFFAAVFGKDMKES